jgi:hypothetical protein
VISDRAVTTLADVIYILRENFAKEVVPLVERFVYLMLSELLEECMIWLPVSWLVWWERK